MKIKIPKITLNAFEIFGNKKLEKELDQQENTVKNTWAGIYADIANGKRNLAYWDEKPVDKPGFHSFVRYALHRSPKKDGFLQLSVMEIRNGEMIPTSDSQHRSAADFINRRVWSSGVDIVTIM